MKKARYRSTGHACRRQFFAVFYLPLTTEPIENAILPTIVAIALSLASGAAIGRLSGPASSDQRDPAPRPPIAVETPKLCSRLLAHVEGLSTGTHPAEGPSLVFLQHYSFFRSFSQEESRTDQKQANFFLPFLSLSTALVQAMIQAGSGDGPGTSLFLVSLSSNHVPCRAETAGASPFHPKEVCPMKNAMRSATPPLHLDPRVLLDGLLHPALLLQRLSSGTGPFQHRDRPASLGAVRPGLRPIAAGGRGARAGRMRRLSLGQLSGRLVGGMGLCALGLLLLPGKWVQGGCLWSCWPCCRCWPPFLYAIGMGCAVQNIPLNFGLARGVGAGAYALASSLCGGLTALWGWGPSLWCCWRPPSCLLVATLTFRPGNRPGPQAGCPGAHHFGGGARLPPEVSPPAPPCWWGATLLYTSHNVIMRFPYQIIQGGGGGGVEMGQLLTVQGLMDIPAMVVFSLLPRRAGCRTWVRLAGVSFFLHALLTWVAPLLPVLFAVQVFEMTGYGLYAVASVCFVRDLVAPEDQVQGQTFFNMTNTLGVVISCFAGGVLLDWAGPQASLAFATLTGAGGMGLVWVLWAGRSLWPWPSTGEELAPIAMIKNARVLHTSVFRFQRAGHRYRSFFI